MVLSWFICVYNKSKGYRIWFFLLTETETMGDDSGFFHWIADMIAASRDRIEEVIGRGNLKWVLIILLVLLSLWYARRRR